MFVAMLKRKRLAVLTACGSIAVLVAIAGGILMQSQDNRQEPQRFSELSPVEAGDLAAVKQWIVLGCRGRTVKQLSHQFDVEPTMDAVVQRMTRAIPREERDAAAKICERELKRSERTLKDSPSN